MEASNLYSLLCPSSITVTSFLPMDRTTVVTCLPSGQ